MYSSIPNKTTKWLHPTVKKYICIGGKYRCAITKIYKKIKPKDLARLYNVNPEECIFFQDENRFKNDNHRTNKFRSNTLSDSYYILRPRKAGDYEFHIAQRKATRLLEDRPI